MATQVKFVTVPSKTLVTSINSSAYAIQLSDILGWDGNALTSANFGGVLWAVLRNSTNTQMEIMQLDPTTIANSQVTVLLRGLDFSGGLVEVTNNKLTWIKNDTIIELGSNPPQLLAQGVMVTGTQTIADLKTFTTLPQSTAVPVSAADFANKAYVDATTGGNANYDQNIVNGVAGANLTAGNVAYLKASDGKWYVADSSATATSVGVQLGIVQATVTSGSTALRILLGGRDKTQTGLTAGNTYYLSTAGAISTTQGANIRLVGQVPSGSTTDLIVNFAGGDPSLATTDSSKVYAADTGSSNAFAIALTPAIPAYKTGQLFFFKASFTNTGPSTLNVNSLGAKTIKKAATLDLASGDIATGQLVAVQYDGTNFQLMSGVANVSLTAANYKFGGTGSDGALTQTSGTTTLAVSSALVFIKNYTSISLSSSANLTISGQPSHGTILVLKSQGNVVLTTPSGTANVIELTGLGASASTAGISAFGLFPTASSNGGNGTGGSSTQGPAIAGSTGLMDITTMITAARMFPFVVGSGGGVGGAAATGFGGSVYGGGGGGGGGTAVILANVITTNSGTFVIAGGNGCTTTSSSLVTPGGLGGGAVYIECGGALTFTGQISVAGTHGGNGTGGGAGGNSSTGGSGTGGNGDTQSNTAGSGGAGGAGAPGAANGSTGSGGGGGASGASYVGLNTNHF